MNVYFINAGYDGCWYVRCLLPMRANGWWGAKTSLRTPQVSNAQMFQGAMAADVVVFQRPMQRSMVEAARLLKQKGKTIVFDNDDTYRVDSGFKSSLTDVIEQQVLGKMEKIDRTLKDFASVADLITVTTPFLAEEYASFGMVGVLPNTVDPEDWPKPKRNEGEKVRVGLVGSPVTTDDCDHILDVIKELSDRPNVELVIFGLPPVSQNTTKIREVFQAEIDFWSQYTLKWQPFVPIEDYMATLNNLELDLMIIPRKDSYFNRCKSNIKFLEAAMLEIPVVAQGFADGSSPYQDPLDMEHMVVVTDKEDWLPAIELLVNNKELRREMGRKAREYVLGRYDINKNAHLWDGAFKELYANHKN